MGKGKNIEGLYPKLQTNLEEKLELIRYM